MKRVNKIQIKELLQISMDFSDEESTVQHFSIPNDDQKKGKAVKEQISAWDKALEARIKLQGALHSCNELPNMKQVDSELKESVNLTKNAIKELINATLECSDIIKSSFEKTKDDGEITSDEDEDEDDADAEQTADVKVCERKRKLSTICEFENEFDKLFKDLKDKRIPVLKKWSERTKNQFGKSNNSKSDFTAFDQSVTKQISQILFDKKRLADRVHLKRSAYNFVDKSKLSANEKYDEDVFDDQDFYHQLLKDLIEKKSSAALDPLDFDRQQLLLTQLRRSTRKTYEKNATKDRQINFKTHQKLISFMAPKIPKKAIHFDDEIKKLLFSSLFGSRSVE